MEKMVKRGYVKWTDEDGVFHKEPLYDHPELLAKASPEEQLAAEEARRLNAAAEVEKEDKTEEVKETLAELKKAPDDVLTAAQLEEGNDLPSDEPIIDTPAKVLEDMREKKAD